MNQLHRFRDNSLSIEQRVDDLVNLLSPAEKCEQLTYAAPAIERLGIPPYNWWNEGLHGVGRAGLATVFPQAIALAATFNEPLIHRVATVISDEARAKHHLHARRGDFGIYKGLTFWSPNINIFRDPRWGRGQETFGECPHLTARLGVAFIRGLQGDDPVRLKVIATPKHFAVHSGPETGRHAFDAVVSAQDLYETYLPAFRAAVTEGKAYSIMGAYNRLNGVPCCASHFLLEETLRDSWGFDGYTVSDCGAIGDIHNHHKLTPDQPASAALAINNGMDLCCGEDFRSLRKAVDLGLVDHKRIDIAVRRLMKARMMLGMFDPPDQNRYAQIPYDVVDCAEHRAISLDAAKQSIVLLKNASNILPLKNDVGSIAVIGPNADARSVLLGNYHGTPSYTVTPLDGIRAKVSRNTRLSYTLGTTHLSTQNPWVGTSDRGFVEAVAAAERADVVILCLGLSPTIEGEEGDAFNSDSGGDRTRVELPDIQQQLMEKIVQTGKPVVLVLIGGSALSVPYAQSSAAAIIQQFYPGQDGGTALADVLFGDHNPSGRLPVTVYRQTSDLPPFDDYKMQHRTYRFCDRPVLYPFGFGLSYSSFTYANLSVDRAELAGGQGCIVTANVKNNGPRSGHEVVQLYLTHRNAPFRKPIRQLVGFRRVALSEAESTTVRFHVSSSQFDLVNANGKSVRVPGLVDLHVGGSQPDSRSAELGAAVPGHITVTLC